MYLLYSRPNEMGVHPHLHRGLHVGNTWHYKIEKGSVGRLWFSNIAIIRITWKLKKKNARDTPQNNWIRISGEWWMVFCFLGFRVILSMENTEEKRNSRNRVRAPFDVFDLLVFFAGSPWQHRANQETLATQISLGFPTIDKEKYL